MTCLSGPAILERIRASRAARRKHRRAEYQRAVLAGECVCAGWNQIGFETDPDCPRMPEHLTELLGYEAWECRECHEPTMFSREGPSATCSRCGSTGGWERATLEAMMAHVRRSIARSYGDVP